MLARLAAARPLPTAHIARAGVQRAPLQLMCAPPQLCRRQRRRPPPAAASSSAGHEPFQPERTFHKGVVGPPEPEDKLFLGLTFSDIYYYTNLAYWSLLLVSVLTGNDFVSRLVRFENYTTAMFASSVAFTLWHTVNFARDVRQHLQSEARRDWRQLLRFAWNAIFWLAFVLWYAAPPVASLADYTGTPGAFCCLYGAGLALMAALQVGHFSFMGSPQVPRRLHTGGVHALARHPQALGNMLMLIGFSLAGGAVLASATFLVAFIFYTATVIPAEERMLREAYGDEYEEYAKRVPRFAWALLLMVALQALLLWRFQPWAVPIEVVPPPAV
ncbi:Cobalt-zinc-cadmium resistance [Micractinium conductrix]|uniref:Cobalt-zinc-cadmium resistance n=1 Tax=Micractinium conductrix TaxID=554055 RepID=A0A2P6V994_9CHLO|nr:Cobalt-zinc-cadmium resistance [Micractinium conductrix]|eukprot:PSC70662.1 Cobalt-zinc-cadmium resistance [Micractinium conductrix]